MKAAVYSGSFNPLHIGHLAIIRHLIDEAGFDYVYLVVSPKNPLKDGISSASGKQRYEDAVEAVARHFHSPSDKGQVMTARPKVIVDDIELNMPEPHYTIRTLDAMSKRDPNSSFTLTIGADNLNDIRRWKDYRRILKEYGVAVFPRRGFDMEAIKSDLLNEDTSYMITLLDAEMVDISSTIIRNAIKDAEDVSQWLM